jgi:hypothetical protein
MSKPVGYVVGNSESYCSSMDVGTYYYSLFVPSENAIKSVAYKTDFGNAFELPYEVITEYCDEAEVIDAIRKLCYNRQKAHLESERENLLKGNQPALKGSKITVITPHSFKDKDRTTKELKRVVEIKAGDQLTVFWVGTTMTWQNGNRYNRNARIGKDDQSLGAKYDNGTVVFIPGSKVHVHVRTMCDEEINEYATNAATTFSYGSGILHAALAQAKKWDSLEAKLRSVSGF